MCFETNQAFQSWNLIELYANVSYRETFEFIWVYRFFQFQNCISKFQDRKKSPKLPFLTVTRRTLNIFFIPHSNTVRNINNFVYFLRIRIVIIFQLVSARGNSIMKRRHSRICAVHVSQREKSSSSHNRITKHARMWQHLYYEFCTQPFLIQYPAFAQPNTKIHLRYFVCSIFNRPRRDRIIPYVFRNR